MIEQREPHARRRREILAEHPEIRALFGHDPRTALVTYAVVAGQLGIAFAFQRLADRGSAWASFWIIAVVAYVVGAFAAKWSGVAIHESSHNLVYRTTRQNLLFSFVANIPVLVPSAAAFRRHHHAHHSSMGIPDRDNDLPSEREVRIVGRSPVRKLVWLAFYVFFGTLARGFVRRPTRWELVNGALQLAANVAIVALGGWTAILYLALSVFFGFGLHPVAGHFIHEHYLWNAEQESYSYYGPLNRLTLNLGYHVEHHDFPAIPSARLPELYALARKHYDRLDSHDSWAWVMWHFVTSRRMGHDSRVRRAA
jgi:sphingolipid 4-desaturase/C4-monooxygenase